MLNRQIVYIFLLQLALCIFASVYGTIWEKNNKQSEYYLSIELTKKKIWVNYLLWTMTELGSWILMFTYFIPISLVVTVELVRVAQALFITWDYTMYDMEKD